MAGPYDEGHMTPPPAFARLGELLYSSTNYHDLHLAICHAAQRLVTGCDHASLMLREGDCWTTPAATDEWAQAIDRLEREAGEGPCIDAIVDETPQLAPDLTDPDAPWPGLRKALLASTPIRGMLGFRIVRERRTEAALNLFSDRAGGFSDDGVDQAAVVAAFCSVALQAAADRMEVTTLRAGLASNREIGKAIGLLMAHHRVDDDEAFTILRRTSNELNLKLAKVADKVIEGHSAQVNA